MSLLVGEQKLQSHVRCSFVSRLFFLPKNAVWEQDYVRCTMALTDMH